MGWDLAQRADARACVACVPGRQALALARPLSLLASVHGTEVTLQSWLGKMGIKSLWLVSVLAERVPGTLGRTFQMADLWHINPTPFPCLRPTPLTDPDSQSPLLLFYSPRPLRWVSWGHCRDWLSRAMRDNQCSLAPPGCPVKAGSLFPFLGVSDETFYLEPAPAASP